MPQAHLVEYHGTQEPPVEGPVECTGCGLVRTTWGVGVGWCPYAQHMARLRPWTGTPDEARQRDLAMQRRNA